MMKLLVSKLKWKKGKMDVHRVLDNWTLTHPSFEKHILQHEIFEKFLTNEKWKEYVWNQISMLNAKATACS